MTAPDRERTRTAPSALAGLALSTALASFGTSSANVALPSLATAFGASFEGIQWIVIAYILAMTASMVAAGRLGDMIGRRRLLLAGIGLFSAAALLCAAAPSLPLLVAARAVQGVGAATMMALAMASIADLLPAARTGGAMATLAATSALGTALGPSLGGLLLAGLGWRAIFLAMLPLGLTALGLAWRTLPPAHGRPAPERARFDVAGAAVLALTLGAYALALTGLAHGPGAVEAGLLAVAAGGVVLFLRIEARAEAPLVAPAILREPALGAALAMSALVSAVVMASLVIGPFYLARGLGLGAAGVGIMLSAGPASAALSGLPAGWAVNRFGPRATTLTGLAGMADGCVLLALLPRAAGLAGYVMPIVVVTGSYALFQTANNSAVMAGAESGRRGVVSGMLNLSRNLGLITGASAIAALFAAAAGADAPPEAVAAAMRLSFGAAAVLVLAALRLAWQSGTPSSS